MELIRNKLIPNLIQITEKALYINLVNVCRCVHTQKHISLIMLFSDSLISLVTESKFYTQNLLHRFELKTSLDRFDYFQ